MAVTTFTTFGLVEFLNDNKVALLMAGYHHLGDTLAVVDNKVFLRQVDKYYTYLATIISIYCSWGIKHGNTLFQCKTTTRPYLRLETYGQSNVESCWNQLAL